MAQGAGELARPGDEVVLQLRRHPGASELEVSLSTVRRDRTVRRWVAERGGLGPMPHVRMGRLGSGSRRARRQEPPALWLAGLAALALALYLPWLPDAWTNATNPLGVALGDLARQEWRLHAFVAAVLLMLEVAWRLLSAFPPSPRGSDSSDARRARPARGVLLLARAPRGNRARADAPAPGSSRSRSLRCVGQQLAVRDRFLDRAALPSSRRGGSSAR